MTQNTSTLVNEAKAFELTVNYNKTKVMELLSINNHANNLVIQGHTIEKVHQFTYLDATISDNNGWSMELNS